MVTMRTMMAAKMMMTATKVQMGSSLYFRRDRTWLLTITARAKVQMDVSKMAVATNMGPLHP